VGAEHGPEVAGVVEGEAEESAPRRREALPCSRALGGAQRRAQADEALPRQGDEEGGPIREVVGGRSVRDAQPPRDVPEAQCLDPLLGDYAERRGDERLARSPR
jgi:hypothetical protein